MSVESEVKSRILKVEDIDWQNLEFLQQDDLKELDEVNKHRLKSSIMANNFVDPFMVWEAPDGKLWCMDGRHRTLLLRELIAEGVQVPYLLPAIFINCKDKKEAAKLVLTYSSGYATIRNEGLYNFLTEYEIDSSLLRTEFSIPDFSVDRFEQKFDLHGVLNSGNDEEDEIPEALSDEEIIVQPGDLFHLGKHRLLCGNCLNESDVALLLEGKKARVVFTDPPYNLAAHEFSGKGQVKHTDFAMGAGEMSDEQFKNFMRDIFAVSAANTVDGAIIYLCMDFRHIWHVSEGAREVFGTVEPKQLCVWNKQVGANGSFYRAKHELVFIYKNGNAKHVSHIDLPDRTRYNVWDYPTSVSFNNPDRDMIREHPTPKPVAMYADAFLDTSNPGDVVVDWFGGSGTGFMAAEQTGRICYATEIEPKYCQVILRRYRKKYPEQEIKCLNRDLDLSSLVS